MANTPNEDLVQRWEGKFAAAESARKPFEKEWFMSLSFYFGKQYAQWASSPNSLGQSLIIPKAPSWRVRLVSNRIKPIIRKETAKIAKSRPHFYILPSSTEDSDISKARVGEAIAEHLLLNNQFDKKKRQGIWWASICGTGYLKTIVNGTRDINYEAPSTFHLWVPDLEVIDIQEQPWIVHGINLTPDEVYLTYGVEAEADSQSATPDNKYFQSLGLTSRQKENSHVFVKEFWVKPCREFPEGAMFVIGNNKLLYLEEGEPTYAIDPATEEPLVDEEGNPVVDPNIIPSSSIGGEKPKSKFPLAHGQYPFQKIDHIPTGRYYAESVIVDLLPLQKEYNRGRSQIAEHKNNTVNPQWGVTRGSVDTAKITNQPGLIVEVVPGFEKPEPIRHPDLPQSAITDLQSTLADIDYTSNQFEISQGRTPPNVEAASAIAFLQEESDSVLSYTIASLEEAVENCGYQSLELVKQYWETGRLVKVASGSDIYEVITFKEDSLPDQIDFKVERDSMAPKSRAAQQAFIMEIIQSGLVAPQDGFKYLEMSVTNRLYEDLQIDARQQRRENFRMQKGEDVKVNPWDNHVAHVITIERYMKSQEFESLAEEIKVKYINHWQEHMSALGKEELDNAGADSIRSDSGTGKSESGATGTGE